MVFRLEVVHKKWQDFFKTMDDLKSVVTDYQFQVQTTPILTAETEAVSFIDGTYHFKHTQ